jgi:hypothetical protein
MNCDMEIFPQDQIVREASYTIKKCQIASIFDLKNSYFIRVKKQLILAVY